MKSRDISIIVEKLYRNELSFDDACNKLNDLLLEKVNEEIYKEITNDN